MQKKKFTAFYMYIRPVYSIQEKKARISLSEKRKAPHKQSEDVLLH